MSGDDAADDAADEVPPAAREEAVGAVRRALAKHGYAGLTTKRIAAESAKSEAFLFYHYDSKEDLVLAFMDWATGRVTDRLEDAAGTPAQRLYGLCDALVGDPGDDIERGTNVAMMELLAHARHNETFRERLETYERTIVADTADLIREGIKAGEFRDVDPESTAAFVLTLADGTVGAVQALGMSDVGEGVRAVLFDYLEGQVLAPGVDPPAHR
ncbi:TetR/AcrR family transcriptional regulator [Haloglomus litoreum]|uniref:TetR/AcrR family transcriptional regulator n=1 Tax=Haloglomus litoreum TaxID=3034026 RepID=UPI0023E7C176|nr:TetR/AcrR family transcriptional regulator [Haloglomus sp. DT116]